VGYILAKMYVDIMRLMCRNGRSTAVATRAELTSLLSLSVSRSLRAQGRRSDRRPPWPRHLHLCSPKLPPARSRQQTHAALSYSLTPCSALLSPANSFTNDRTRDEDGFQRFVREPACPENQSGRPGAVPGYAWVRGRRDREQLL
jgi:hypothetical protein